MIIDVHSILYKNIECNRKYFVSFKAKRIEKYTESQTGVYINFIIGNAIKIK